MLSYARRARCRPAAPWPARIQAQARQSPEAVTRSSRPASSMETIFVRGFPAVLTLNCNPCRSRNCVNPVVVLVRFSPALDNSPGPRETMFYLAFGSLVSSAAATAPQHAAEAASSCRRPATVFVQGEGPAAAAGGCRKNFVRNGTGRLGNRIKMRPEF